MPPDPNPPLQAPNTQRYLDLLHSMLDIAHEVARDIHQQATTPAEPGAKKPDYTIPIERITRTIRRTILLALKVAEPPKPERAAPKPGRAAARKRILREVEDHINRNTEDEDETASLQAELLDRLDSEDLEDELDTRPVQDIIIDIVRDLNLDSDWGPNRFKRRSINDIETLRARAAELPSLEPRPPRTASWPPPPRAVGIPLPDNPAAAVAMILGTAGRRHGN